MKIKKIIGLIAVIGLVAGAMSGCKNETVSKEQDSGKIIVAVSIVPQETFVNAVCGELADVVTMIPPGNSPENYEPTPQLIQEFSNADIYFSIDVPTEESFIYPNISPKTQVVSLADKVAEEYPDRELDGGRDPHIWMSPKRAVVMVRTIAEEMGKLDSKNSETYNSNAEEYIKKIEKADEDIQNALNNVESKKFIVFHPAFGYFADDYGLKMYALEEDGKEATSEHLREMIDLSKKENIKVIFYQAEIDSSQSKAFAEEIGGKTIQLEPLSADYINNLENMAKIIAEAMK